MHEYKGHLEKERIGLLEIKSFFTSISDGKYTNKILNSVMEVSDVAMPPQLDMLIQ